MVHTGETTAQRLTITVNGIDLSVDEPVRRTLLANLRAMVHDVLMERHGFEVAQDDIRVATGDRYAQVAAACPRLGERLDRLILHKDNANGAFGERPRRVPSEQTIIVEMHSRSPFMVRQ